MIELQKHFKSGVIEAGCDEAGRGCLAGPVFAAAVILNPDIEIKGLNDSKKLNAHARDKLRLEIEEKALAFGVGFFTNKQIDKVNILKASFGAMHLALNKLPITPELILVDGNRFVSYKNIPHQCIVKGDAKFQSIAAASILAKTYRDEFMLNAHQSFPEYGWNKNMGYPTLKHRDAIAKYGTTNLHRMSFTLLSKQIKLPV